MWKAGMTREQEQTNTAGTALLESMLQFPAICKVFRLAAGRSGRQNLSAGTH